MARQIEMEVSVDTTRAEIKLLKLQDKMKTLRDLLARGKLSSEEFDDWAMELNKAENEANKLKNTMKNTAKESTNVSMNLKNVSAISKSTGSNFTDLGKKIESSFGNATKKARRFVLSLFSIRSAFSVVSKASQAYLNQNEATANKINATWTYLGNIVGPIIERIATWIQYGLGYFNRFIKALTGIDFMAKTIKKDVGGANKELKKTLSSMDEIVNLDLDNGSGNDGAGISDILDDVTLNNKIAKLMDNIGNWGKSIWEKVKNSSVTDDWSWISTDGIKALNKIRDFIEKTDFANLGKKIGKKIGDGILSVDWLGLAWTFIKTMASGIAESYDFLYGALKGLYESIINKILSWLGIKGTDLGDSLVSGFSSGLARLSSVIFNPFGAVIKLVKTIFGDNGTESSVFKDIGLKIVKGFVNGIMYLPNAISNIFDSIIGLVNSKINSLSNGMSNKLKNAFSITGTIGKIFGFATGGFPEEGQLFYANERGPEMVGTIGGSTAVVNNAQIVESVSQGVAQAVASTLGSTRSGSQSATYLYINGSEFAKAIYDDMDSENRRRNTNTSIRRA